MGCTLSQTYLSKITTCRAFTRYTIRSDALAVPDVIVVTTRSCRGDDVERSNNTSHCDRVLQSTSHRDKAHMGQARAGGWVYREEIQFLSDFCPKVCIVLHIQDFLSTLSGSRLYSRTGAGDGRNRPRLRALKCGTSKIQALTRHTCAALPCPTFCRPHHSKGTKGLDDHLKDSSVILWQAQTRICFPRFRDRMTGAFSRGSAGNPEVQGPALNIRLLTRIHALKGPTLWSGPIPLLAHATLQVLPTTPETPT